MTKNLDNEGLSSIVDNYELFYIDLWGVVHNGINLHIEAIKTLKEISKKNKDYILLTNAPRPNSSVKSFLEKLSLLIVWVIFGIGYFRPAAQLNNTTLSFSLIKFMVRAFI